jgi:polysaccharide biosynthesis transport protein
VSNNFQLMTRSRKRGELSQPAAILPPARGGGERWPSHRGERWPSHPQPAPQARDWQRAVRTLKRHWRLSALFAGATFALVAVATLLMKPVYESTARIEIDPPGAELFSLQATRFGGMGDNEYLETQAQNLQSDQLAVTVIRKLRLDRNPIFVGETDDVVQASSGSVSGAASSVDDSEQYSSAERRALLSFRQRLVVRRDTGSRLIYVSFASPDPKLSADVTNTLLRSYIDHVFKTRHDAILQSTEWLSKQLDDIRQKMEDSNRALAEFQKSTGIINLDEGSSSFGQRMAELNKQLTEAQAQRIELGAFLDNVTDNNGKRLPQVGNNPVVQGLTSRLGEVRSELAMARVIYGDKHPNVQKLQNQADALQAQIDEQRATILAGLKTSYNAAKAREQKMSGEMNLTSKQLNQLAQYASLKKEAEADAALYNGLYSRIKEAGIAAAGKASNIRILDHAQILDTPTKPKVQQNLLFGMLAGVIGGIMLAFLKDAFDDHIRTPEDIKKWTGLSNITIVPQIVSDQSRAANFLSLRNGGSSIPQTFVLGRPDSPEAEALRALKTSLMLSQAGKPLQALLIASSSPGEGKSTVAINLAIALARHGRTCLVDADLRGADLADAFQLSPEHGLCDVLAGSIRLDDAFQKIADTDLVLIPAGRSGIDSAQLLSPEKARHLVGQLRSHFEFVVIDSPPLLAYTEGMLLSPTVDGVVLVGRSGASTGEAMARSVEILQQVHAAPIVGIVLNAAKADAVGYEMYRYKQKRRAA